MAKSASTTKKAKAVAPSAAAPVAKSTKAPAPASSDSDASSEDTSDASDSEPEVSAPAAPVVKVAARLNPLVYTPPEGYKLAKVSVEKSEFDWDEINRDPNVQLWAIKVPKGFKAKYLESMEIKLPSSIGQASSSVPSRAVGHYERKGSEYDAFIVADLEAERAAEKKKSKDKGKGKRTKDQVDEEDAPKDDPGHGGQEIRSLVPLLPKHSAGNKLFVAPRPISLALSLTLRPPPSVLPNASSLSSLIASQPDPVPGSVLSAADLLDPDAIQAKKRVRTQPAGLRMRLQLPGTRAGDALETRTTGQLQPEPVEVAEPDAVPVGEDAMEVDEEVVPVKKEKKERSEEEVAARKAKKDKKRAKKESD